MGFHSYGNPVCCIGQTASTVVCADLLRDVQGRHALPEARNGWRYPRPVEPLRGESPTISVILYRYITICIVMHTSYYYIYIYMSIYYQISLDITRCDCILLYITKRAAKINPTASLSCLLGPLQKAPSSMIEYYDIFKVCRCKDVYRDVVVQRYSTIVL